MDTQKVTISGARNSQNNSTKILQSRTSMTQNNREPAEMGSHRYKKQKPTTKVSIKTLELFKESIVKSKTPNLISAMQK